MEFNGVSIEINRVSIERLSILIELVYCTNLGYHNLSKIMFDNSEVARTKLIVY